MEKGQPANILASIEGGLNIDKAGEAYASLDESDRSRILDGLKALKTESTGHFLNLVLPLEKEKSLRKEIKRLLFRLKSVGVKVEDRPAEGPSVLKKTDDTRLHRGFVSNYDPMATRVVIVALELKKHLFAFFHGAIHFSQGLLELASGSLKRKDLEDILEEYRSFTKEPLSLAEISPVYAAFLLEEASALSGKYTAEARQICQFAIHVPSDASTPDAVYHLPVDDAPAPLPLETIFSEDLFSPFVLQWATKDDDIKAYQDLEGSTIVLPDHMMQEKKEAFIKAFLDRDDFRPIVGTMKRLVEDYAYMLYRLGRLDAYRGLIEALRNPAFPGEAVLFYIKRGLEAKKEEVPQPGLIVSPYEQIRR
jgi:hypothetical protein